MDKAKNYVFFVDLPIMQNKFYFHCEVVEMKQPPIAVEEFNQNKILHVSRTEQEELAIKDFNTQSAKIILDSLQKYEQYENYEGTEDSFYYHYHNLMEISVVLSGEGYYFVEGKAIKVKKGSVIMFNRLVPHAWWASKDNPPIQKTYTLYPTLLIGNEIENEENVELKEYLSQMTYVYVDGEQGEKYRYMLEYMSKEYIEQQEGYRKIIKQLVMMFFTVTWREDKRNTCSKKNKNNSDIENAIKYMKSNFHNDITLEEVASQVYMHPNYFSSIFKRKCGICFADYINILKINMATELMHSTELSTEEIANQCGFKSLSNFYRVFKKIHHMSPMKYIKQI